MQNFVVKNIKSDLSHLKNRRSEQLHYIKHYLKTTKVSCGPRPQLNARRASPVYPVLKTKSHQKIAGKSLKKQPSNTIQIFGFKKLRSKADLNEKNQTNFFQFLIRNMISGTLEDKMPEFI